MLRIFFAVMLLTACDDAADCTATTPVSMNCCVNNCYQDLCCDPDCLTLAGARGGESCAKPGKSCYYDYAFGAPRNWRVTCGSDGKVVCESPICGVGNSPDLGMLRDLTAPRD
jgi:hypothetical protein